MKELIWKRTRRPETPAGGKTTSHYTTEIGSELYSINPTFGPGRNGKYNSLAGYGLDYFPDKNKQTHRSIDNGESDELFPNIKSAKRAAQIDYETNTNKTDPAKLFKVYFIFGVIDGDRPFADSIATEGNEGSSSAKQYFIEHYPNLTVLAVFDEDELNSA